MNKQASRLKTIFRVEKIAIDYIKEAKNAVDKMFGFFINIILLLK